MKLSMTIMAILWSSAFGLGLMNFIQSSSPVAGPVYPDCLQFYQAKPGDSCQSIADAHSITLLDFIWMNEAMAVNTRAPMVGEWYWVKGGELSSTASPPSASQYANNVVDKRSMIPSYPTKRVIEPVCRHYELQNMDLPKSLNGMCKQRNLCQDISSVCSCWRKEKTTLGLRREQLWWRRNMNVKVPVLRIIITGLSNGG
ncbi:putative class V chitinase [Colletotrichum asianum]